MAIRKGNKHQLGLFFLLEACQRNAAGWSTAVWPANAKLPLPHRRSSITRPCCSIKRSSAKLLVFTYTSKFERSTGSESERVDALGLRAVEVIICMITRDFSVISMTSQASLSLSLSLPLTKVTDAQYRKRFRASYNKMPKTILRSWARVFSFSDRELEKFILEMWVDSPIKTSSLYFLWSWAWDTYFSKSEVDSPIKTSSLYFLWSWAWNIYSFTVRTWAWAYLFLV